MRLLWGAEGQGDGLRAEGQEVIVSPRVGRGLGLRF